MPRALDQDEHNRRYALYRRGMSDDEIAKALGTTEAAIHNWRWRAGLRANCRRRTCNSLAPGEEGQRMALYRQGLSDGEIARELGLKRQTVAVWRYRRHLPSNRPACRSYIAGVPMEQALTPEQCDVMRNFLQAVVGYDKMTGGALRGETLGRFMQLYREDLCGYIAVQQPKTDITSSAECKPLLSKRVHTSQNIDQGGCGVATSSAIHRHDGRQTAKVAV